MLEAQLLPRNSAKDFSWNSAGPLPPLETFSSFFLGLTFANSYPQRALTPSIQNSVNNDMWWPQSKGVRIRQMQLTILL